MGNCLNNKPSFLFGNLPQEYMEMEDLQTMTLYAFAHHRANAQLIHTLHSPYYSDQAHRSNGRRRVRKRGKDVRGSLTMMHVSSTLDSEIYHNKGEEIKWDYWGYYGQKGKHSYKLLSKIYRESVNNLGFNC